MIPSLQEYLLISQDTRHMEHYVRQPDNHWLLSEVSATDDLIFMPSVESKLAVSDVYEKIDLS